MMKLTIDFLLAAPEEELTKTNKTNILAKSVSMIWGVDRRNSHIETRGFIEAVSGNREETVEVDP
jgi:hypothetical protein